MLDDYKIITHDFQVSKIEIIPLSDLHIGAKSCLINEIKKVVKYIAETPNVYCTLGGDIIDNAVLVGKNLGMFDVNLTPMQSIKMAVDILKPLADNNKILGCVSGNHEFRSEKVTELNPMYLIARELGIDKIYRRNLAVIKVRLGTKNNNQGVGKQQVYTILLHHGKGTSESALKKDFEFINKFEGADIIFTGHTHHGRWAKENKKFINKQSDIVTDREVTAIVTNSFLSDANYSLENMMVGANNSIISIELFSGKKKRTRVIS